MSSFDAEMNAMLDRLGAANDGFVVAALYKFVSLDDIDGLRQTLQQLCDKNQILGTILLAEEGINGTIAASRDGMAQCLNWLEADGRFEQLSLKFSHLPIIIKTEFTVKNLALYLKRYYLRLKRLMIFWATESIGHELHETSEFSASTCLSSSFCFFSSMIIVTKNRL